MDLKRTRILSVLAILMMVTTQIVLAQDPAPEASQPPLITSSQEVSAPKEGDLQWAWGELVSIDSQAQTITLKYLDYDTDQEKELVLAVDDKTTFENIKDFSELKVKDTLSIDYVVDADNRNIAKNISFEKTDDSSVPAPADPLTPSTAAAVVAEPAIAPPAGFAAAEPAAEPAATPAASEPVMAAPIEAAPAAPEQAQ